MTFNHSYKVPGDLEFKKQASDFDPTNIIPARNNIEARQEERSQAQAQLRNVGDGGPGSGQKGHHTEQESEQKPMSYKEFIASGRPDKEWEAYASEQNQISKQKGFARTKAKWASEGSSGNDIANLLRAHGVGIPEHMQRGLQHDDTVVSATAVSGRGMGRAEAKQIHKWVSEQMHKIK